MVLVSLLLTLVFGGCLDEPKRLDHSVMPGIDEVAANYADLLTPRWEGERTEAPGFVARPFSAGSIASEVAPLRVHVQTADDLSKAQRALHALERVHARIEEAGWETPLADGIRGGDNAFDLYLSPSGEVQAFADERLFWSHLDAVSTYGVVDPEVSEEDLEVCVAQALGEAIGLTLDPSEASAWRRGLGTYLAHLATGRFGCGGLARIQESAHLAWTPHGELGPDRAALLLMLLPSVREDHDSFVRDVWDFARQRTWDGFEFRASPDFWEALTAIQALRESSLDDLLTELGTTRFFLGEREAGNTRSVVRHLGAEASPALFAELDADALPYHSRNTPTLAPTGSAHALLHLGEREPGSRLRIWLRGETGVKWALEVSPLDEHGSEISRISAPPSDTIPRAFLLLELDEDARDVVISVTNLSHRRPDADDPDEINHHGFSLIMEFVGAGEADPLEARLEE